MSRATLPGSLWTPYLVWSAATAAASSGAESNRSASSTNNRSKPAGEMISNGAPCRSGREICSLGSQDRAAGRDFDGGNAPGEQRHEPVTVSAAKQSGVLRQG